MVNIVLAGGGTAGHTSPLIATAQALIAADPQVSITCVGTHRGLETRVIPEAGFRLELVPPVPMPRKPNADLVKLPVRVATSVRTARGILKKARADAVVGFGGYVSVPAYLAARSMRIPVIVHEQNMLPGLANKLASRFAREVITTFPDTPLARARCEGMPLRKAITDLAIDGRAASRAKARERFALDPNLPVVLVSGGSQGAVSINNAIRDACGYLTAASIQVLHILGAKNYAPSCVREVDPSTGAVYQPVAYVDDMNAAYAAADLMVARSGAGTVAETACVGLPTILVPLAIGNGEQARNARGVVKAGVALLIRDDQIRAHPQHLIDTVMELIADRQRLDAMSAAGPALFAADAADRIAQIIYSVAKG